MKDPRPALIEARKELTRSGRDQFFTRPYVTKSSLLPASETLNQKLKAVCPSGPPCKCGTHKCKNNCEAHVKYKSVNELPKTWQCPLVDKAYSQRIRPTCKAVKREKDGTYKNLKFTNAAGDYVSVKFAK
jgi:hypothetical protein